MTNRNEITNLNVYFPVTLRERARVYAKRLHTSTNQLIRDALAEYLDRLEDKDLHRKNIASVIDDGPKRGRPPIKRPAIARPALEPISKPKLDAVYDEYAWKILAAKDDLDEVRRLGAAAVAAIKRASPLLHPPETAILQLLENAVVKLRDDRQPPARTSLRGYDNLVGAVLDTKRVRTRGEIASVTDQKDGGDDREDREEITEDAEDTEET